jgi:hypothetical protein
MPILKNDKNINEDITNLKKKRDRRDKTKTRYQLIRKDKPKTNYEYIEVYVNGKKMELTESSRYLLEMLIKDQD